MERKRQEQRTAEKKEALIASSGVGARELATIRAGFTSLHSTWTHNQTLLHDKIGKGTVIALLGTRGTGKTLAASIEVVEACKREQIAHYVSALAFYIRLRASYNPGAAESEEQVIAKYIRPSLLVVDEAHERGDTPWVDRMLTFLVDQRYQAMKDTILIANQTPAEFAKSVGASVIDRAREGGGILLYDWASFRGGK